MLCLSITFEGSKYMHQCLISIQKGGSQARAPDKYDGLGGRHKDPTPPAAIPGYLAAPCICRYSDLPHQMFSHCNDTHPPASKVRMFALGKNKLPDLAISVNCTNIPITELSFIAKLLLWASLSAKHLYVSRNSGGLIAHI